MNKLLKQLCILLLLVAALGPIGAQSKHRVDSLKMVLRQTKNDSIRARTLYWLCDALQKQNPKMAEQYGLQSAEIALSGGYPKLAIKAYNTLGTLYYNTEQMHQCIEVNEKALALNSEFEMQEDIRRRLGNLCGLYLSVGDYDKSSEAAERYITMAEEEQNDSLVAMGQDLLGKIFYSKGDYNAAIDKFLTALKYYESQGMQHYVGAGYDNIAMVYYRQSNYEKALHYCNLALKVKEETGDMDGIGGTLTTIGNIHEENGRFDEALKYHQQALELRQRLGYKGSSAISIGNIANIYKDQGNLEQALEYYLEALIIFEETAHKQSICISLVNLADLYMQLANYRKATEYGISAVDIAEGMQAKELMKASYEMLSKVYENSGNQEEAYNYHRLYGQMKDSILNEQSAKQIAEMEAKYQSEKKAGEIEILTTEKEIQDLRLAQNRNVLIAAGGGLALMVLLGGFVLWGFLTKRKANQLLEHQNQEITAQKTTIEEKNKDIVDSINYAQQIQQAILPPHRLVQQLLPNSFILYQPKDIVSGDFYWFDEAEGRVLFAAVDCTGHGVPGAFMSIVGHNYLKQAVNEKGLYKPAEILDFVNDGISKTLHARGDASIKDGMDLALCALDLKSNQLQYAGAFNPLFLVRSAEVIEYKANRQSIGGAAELFTNQEIQLQNGDSIYVFSDGFADQFGGTQGKKFMTGQLKKVLSEIATNPLEQQKIKLVQAFDSWKGSLEQVDDVCLIGVQIP